MEKIPKYNKRGPKFIPFITLEYTTDPHSGVADMGVKRRRA